MDTAGDIFSATSLLIFVPPYLCFPKFLRKRLASLWFNLTLHLVRSITNYAVHIVRKWTMSGVHHLNVEYVFGTSLDNSILLG